MIHPTAILDKKVHLAPDAHIGPYCQIGPNVEIRAGTVLHSHVVIHRDTILGEGNEIFPFTVIGCPSQELKKFEKNCRVIIGAQNIIREHVSINASSSPGGETRIGNHNLLMGGVHVAHDCHLENHVILSQGVGLAGHVLVEDHAVLGGQAGAHQYVRIGRLAMVGGKGGVVQDVPPYAKVRGLPARLEGINQVGLERAHFPREIIEQVSHAFELLHAKNYSYPEAIQKIEQDIPMSPAIKHLIQFLKVSKRGICHP